MTRPTLCNNDFDFSVVLGFTIHICNILIPIIKLKKCIPLIYFLVNLSFYAIFRYFAMEGVNYSFNCMIRGVCYIGYRKSSELQKINDSVAIYSF